MNHSEDILFFSWKLLASSALFALLLCSALMVIVLYRISPIIQSRRGQSLRDQHVRETSRLGGIGIAWTFIITVTLLWLLPFEERGLGLKSLDLTRMLGLAVGGGLAWALGFVDDVFQIRARWKLCGQFAVAVLAILSGFEFRDLQGPFFQSLVLGDWSWLVTLFWIVGVMNAINLIDGLDGLASGLAMVALSVMGLMCWSQGNFALLLVVMVALGATMGFWTFNRPPASIFMGDSGSLFLGYLLALLSIWSTENQGQQSMLPALILAVPILDTCFALFRRFLKGIPFYSADKDHLHHRILAKGFSPARGMLLLVGLSVLFGAMALFAFHQPNLQGFAYIGAIVLAYLLLYTLEYDVIRKPLSSIRDQGDHRKRRALMLAISDQIDEFLAKDPDQETCLRSFHYWVDLAGVVRVMVSRDDITIANLGAQEHSDRELIFRKDSWSILVGLPQESWTVDSDVKAEHLERGSLALIERLNTLDKQNTIPLRRPENLGSAEA